VSVVHRQSWVWAVLPESATRVDSHGDPALAEVLRESGYSVGGEHSGHTLARNGGIDAVLYDTEGLPDADDVVRAAAELGDGGVVSIAVAGGRVTPPKAVPAPLRAAQLLLQPLETLRALAGARRVERSLKGAGLRSTRLATGDRSRSRYGLGRGGWVKRLRTPVGYVLTGSRGAQPASLLEAVLAEAEASTGVSLHRRSTTVFESGKVVMDLRGNDDREYFMRLAAGPSLGPLSAAIVAVHAVAAANPAPVVLDRVVVPRAHGKVGPLRYSLEPNATGSHPWRMTNDLWAQSLDFLVELFPLDLSGSEVPEERSFAQQAARMDGYIDSGERSAMESVVSNLERRLAGVPRGQGHGDFWGQNLLVERGRLATVLDWEWATRNALPAIDLFDMIALSRRRVRDFTPGERLTEVLLPLARSGGDDRVREYCRRLELPQDPATLEALAVAYWLHRVARQLAPLSVFPQREGWAERNLRHPIRELTAAGW